MGSHEEDSVRIAEALCLEVRPLQKTTFRIKFGHRKAFSLDSTCTLHEALYMEAETPGPSSVHTQGCDLRTGHLLRSRISRQASISQWHRESPSAQHSFSGFSIRSRTSLQPLRSNLSRNPHMSSEDLEGGSSHNQRASLMSHTSSVEEHEVGEQTLRAAADLSMASTLLTPTLTVEDRISRREKKRLKSLRRRQKRRERGRQNDQRSTGNLSSSSEEDEQPGRDREGFICAVCLDVYFSPYMCHPCSHIFCEPCLRTLAKNCPSNTPCPLCRTTITHVFFQKELNQTARTFFPKEYMARKQNFQKASCARWPLPSCRKLFRIFGGFQRQASPIARRQFPHGGYRLDAFNFEDDSHGWRFDMDMVIIYIYSVNWVIGFFIFCLFCYFFFLSL